MMLVVGVVNPELGVGAGVVNFLVCGAVALGKRHWDASMVETIDALLNENLPAYGLTRKKYWALFLDSHPYWAAWANSKPQPMTIGAAPMAKSLTGPAAKQAHLNIGLALTCPECSSVVTVDRDGDAICPNCDYVLTMGITPTVAAEVQAGHDSDADADPSR